ncbi:Pcl8/Pcl10 [Kluyveromyces lactis]|nr:Pcl8/Pcl10 [Kluyveromyces lactis]
MVLSGSTSPRNAFIGDKRDWFKVNGVLDRDEECDPSDFDVEDESFGLPLKSRHLDGNFDDVLHTADSKKVRFAEGKNRMTVEQLLENTSNLNMFFENNIEKITDFKSGLDVQEWYRSTTPDTPTGISAKATASAGSASNFQLSEAGDRDTSTAGGLESDQESNVFDRRLSNLLASTSVTDYKLNNEDNNNSHNELNRLPKSFPLEKIDDQRDSTLLIHSLLKTNLNNNEVFGLEMTSREALQIFDDFLQLALLLSSNMRKNAENGMTNHEGEVNDDNNNNDDDDDDDDDDDNNKNSSNNNNASNDGDNFNNHDNDNTNDENNNQNTSDNNKNSDIGGDTSNDNDNMHNEPSATKSKTEDDIEMEIDHWSHENLEETSNIRAIFQMKSAPTLSVSQYLDRIESKCSFPPIIYLTASFLLVTYCDIKFDTGSGKFHIENPITESMTHRLLIAFIRLAAKLLEDHVHSHSYFSKVCGISKKLLSKLELNLVLILQDTQDGLLITELSIKTVLALHEHINLV